MKKLSKDAEDRLLVAIEKAAALASDGLPPSDAIAKAAAETGVPPGHVNLMVYAYNTGRTTRQREDGDDVFSKSADFELADAQAVLEKLYPNQVKTAAAARQQTVVSTSYALSPSGILDRRESRQIKQAGQAVDWRSWSRGENLPDVQATTPPPLPGDPVYAVKKAYSNARRRQDEIDEARRRMHAAHDRMAATFTELTEYFKEAYAQPITVVRGQVELLHGAKAAQLIDEIVKVTPGLLKLSHHKRASYDPSRLAPADGAAYGLVSQFLDQLDEYKREKRAYEQTLTTNRGAIEETLAPFVVSPASVLDAPAFWVEAEKQAAGFGQYLMPGLMGASAATNVMKGLGAAEGERAKALTNASADLVDPRHEQKLRNIASAATLQDMMLNDPVVSSYPAEDVITAYNDIVELAPRAANQRLVVQSLLRKRMAQGAFDPFEVDQLLGMEDKQKKIQDNRTGAASA